MSIIHINKHVKVSQLCLALCDPMDCNPPGSSVHGLFQARILERVALSFSRGFPLAVVLPPPGRGAGTLIPSAQRLGWAAKQPLGNAALGALFA